MSLLLLSNFFLVNKKNLLSKDKMLKTFSRILFRSFSNYLRGQDSNRKNFWDKFSVNFQLSIECTSLLSFFQFRANINLWLYPESSTEIISNFFHLYLSSFYKSISVIESTSDDKFWNIDFWLRAEVVGNNYSTQNLLSEYKLHAGNHIM